MDIDLQPIYQSGFNSFADDSNYSNFSLRGKKYWADVRAKEAEAAAKSAEATRLLAQARAVEQAAADASLIALENAKKAAADSAAAEAQRILAEKKTETGIVTADVEQKAAEVKSATDIKQAEIKTVSLQSDVANKKRNQTIMYIGGGLIIVAIFYYISKK